MEFKGIENKQNFKCNNCGKKLEKGDNIHFMSKPQFIGDGEDFSTDDEEVEPVCEECHNKMFGED